MRDRFPWARLLLGLAVVGPPLGIGGMRPWVLPLFVLVVIALMARVARPGRTSIRRPRGLAWFGVAAGLTALQWVPLGTSAVGALAPGIAEITAQALGPTPVPPWSRVSVFPGATGMELARLAALGILFVSAAQLSWQPTATATVVAATAVALVGIVHQSTGTSAIYGLYPPVEVSVFGSGRVGVLTSFVNPNHQSALLLLGITATVALLSPAGSSDEGTPQPRRLRPELEFALLAALALQTVVLLLSSSRAAIVIAGGLAIVHVASLARRPPQSLRRGRGLLVALAVAIAMAVALDGDQLRTQLESLLAPDALESRLSSVRAGLRLIELSPWLGTGRGTTIDLFALVRDDLDPVVVTHIESVPITMLVEWGPGMGAGLLLAAGVWWGQTLRAADHPGPRRLALGLLAVALHNTVDLNLDTLGVAAPWVAIAGSIAPSHPRRLRSPHRVWWLIAAFTLAVALATFQTGPVSLGEQHQAVAHGTLDPDVALARRPLDARLHIQLARLAAAQADGDTAAQHARLATRLAPAMLDPWLLYGAAATARGQTSRAHHADAEALRRLRAPVDPGLVTYLTGRYSPDQLARLIPSRRAPTQALIEALMSPAPDHADAVAAAWVAAHPSDPFALAHRVELALVRSNPALALHHARLYRAQHPTSARATGLVARALGAFEPPRPEDIRRLLEQALATNTLDDPAAIEERLIQHLVQIGSPEALDRARQVADQLLQRPAPRAVRQRRRRLTGHLLPR